MLSVLDYYMSKEFGLDWKQYDSNRMIEFIRIRQFEIEEKNKRQKNQKPYGRP